MNRTAEMQYFHTVLEGNAYEAGLLQGEQLRQIPEAEEFFASGKGRFSPAEMKSITALFDRICPGLNEEIRGFADGLKITPDAVVFYAQTYLKAGECAHFAVLPSISENGHLLSARSYEFGPAADDFRLCTTRINGKAAHIGCSIFLFGRSEGMNEHGIGVTMSVAGMPVGYEPGMTPPLQDGLHFWALLRAVLDRCKSMDEALDLVEKTTLGCNLNLIITDRAGKASLVEISGNHIAVKTIDSNSEQQYLCSTNHLTIPEMIPFVPERLINSVVRYDAIRNRLDAAAPKVNSDTIKGILSSKYPDGLCCHYYDEFFGTLRSMIFDVTAGEVEVCFGSPADNAWHRFDLSDTIPLGPYPFKMLKETADPNLADRENGLGPGCLIFH